MGMTLWKDGSDSSLFLSLYLHANSDSYAVAQMLLIQGTMSAISAGMLIYAGTVEMIAGDFVFGDVDGGHGHGHLPHSDPHQRPDNRDEGKQLQEHLKMGATTTKKVLAVLSLFAGVAGMVIIG